MNINHVDFDVTMHNIKDDSVRRYARLQSRKAFLRDMIRTEENLIKYLKDVVSYLWEQAVPDSEDGLYYFHEYKSEREYLRQAKKRRKHLVELQLENKAEMLEVSNLISDNWYNRLV